MSLNPGINPQSKFGHFTDEEQQIIQKLSREWYVTNAGDEFRLANSVYRYCLLKPVSNYQEMFNLEREVVAIFSPHTTFQRRDLDAIDHAINQYPTLRVEPIVGVLISQDNAVENKLRDLLKNDKESRIVIPFTFAELLAQIDDYFLRNRFKAHSYTRDLFAFESPLKKEFYFFGRHDLVLKLINRHRANENCGLFGLRKTGKTSVIFGVERTLSRVGEKSAFIDCQNPGFHQRTWNKALYYIITEIINQHNLNIVAKPEELYTVENAPRLFEREMLRIHEKLDKKNILLIFDEIENITFNISPSEHWSKGTDFIFFWQTLRSSFQKLNNVFSYMIVGTNPMCIEVPMVHGKDNPIFNQVPFEYIPSFDVLQTREMVRKLGRIMGINFDEIIYSKLTEDFGGHPFLIRHVCSVINRICVDKRPIFIDKTIYEEAKNIFYRDYAGYIEMILTVLNQYYNDEYAMLEYLALGDMKTFRELANLSPYYTNHLLGYGIIENYQDRYAPKIEAVKQHLVAKKKYKKLNLTSAEMLQEISERRNSLELQLRQMVRNQLKATYGKTPAREKVLDLFGEPRKSKFGGSSYEDLFDSNKCQIYFEDIRKLIITNWDAFKNIFTSDKTDFNSKMQAINKYRIDAHAKKLSLEEMQYFRVCVSSIENYVNEFYAD